MNENDYSMKDRIGKLIQIEGLAQRAFAIKAGINPSNLNQVMLGNRSVPKNLPSKIATAFPEVRIEWLLTGNGEMYKADQHLLDTQALNEHMGKLPTKPRLPKNMSEGHIEEYYNGRKRVLCMEKPVVTQFSDYDFSLILKNNRMSPKYERGDELFFKLARFPEWGNDFLLDTDDGPKFKRIYEDIDEDGDRCVRCVSYNKTEYPDFTVKRGLIHNFYRCVGVLRIL